MLVGYMRVSSDTDRQTTDLQRDALIEAGVDPRQLFADKASGARDDRPGLRQALAYVHPGDCLIVWKLDRLGRSLPHLLQIVTTLHAQGVAFRSLTEQMDTTTCASRKLIALVTQQVQSDCLMPGRSKSSRSSVKEGVSREPAGSTPRQHQRMPAPP
jgi:DNA invertase Pin-like site-specific DNA recombinase